LKAVSQLFPEHEAQLINYMHITKQPVDYLINFVHKDTLESKRFILSELIPASKNQHRLAQISGLDFPPPIAVGTSTLSKVVTGAPFQLESRP